MKQCNKAIICTLIETVSILKYVIFHGAECGCLIHVGAIKSPL